MTNRPENQEKSNTTEIRQSPSAAGAKKHDTITMIVRQEKKNNGGRSVLTLAFVGAVVIGLIIVGLFLPPIDLYGRYFDTDSDFVDLTDAPSQGQLTVRADGDAGNILLKIDETSAEDYLLERDLPDEWQCRSAATAPTYLNLVGSVYSIDQRGSSDGNVQLSFTVEDADSDLDIYGFDDALSRWRFIPHVEDGNEWTAVINRAPSCIIFAQPDSLPLVNSVLVSQRASINQDLVVATDRIYVHGLVPTRNGSLAGRLPSGTNSNQRGVVPVIANFTSPDAIDELTIEALLRNPTARDLHVTQLATFAASGDYIGIAIDYRQLRETRAMGDRYNRFLIDLSRALQSQGQILIVVLPPPELVDGEWQTGAYDWQAIGQIVSEVIVRAPSNPDFYDNPNNFRDMLTWATTQINRYQLFVSLSTEGRLATATGDFAPATAADLQNIIADAEARLREDFSAGETITILPEALTLNAERDQDSSYLVINGVDDEFYLADAALLSQRYQAIQEANVGGVVLSNYLHDTSLYLPTLAVFYDDVTLTLDNLPTVVVADGLGNVISTVADNQLTFTVPDNPDELSLQLDLGLGNITVAAADPDMVDDSPVTEETPAPTEVAQEPTATSEATAEPTLEPTEEPTIEATDEPEATATEEPTIAPTDTVEPTATIEPTVAFTDTPEPTATTVQLATNTPLPSPTIQRDPTATFAPVSLPPAAGFEPMQLGGLIEQQTESTYNVMRSAGMNWIVVRINYSNRANPSQYRQQIQDWKTQGFNVMFIVVGNRFDLTAENYISNYANYIAALTAFEADAIQIWSAPNSPQFWPEAEIDPANYAELVSASAQLSDVANSNTDTNTLLISAALAPDPNLALYYQGMAAAGVANVVDCIGVRYDLGTVPPAASEGDPRGNDPYYYLQPSINVAFDAFGGSRPVCLTLGYVSAEDYTITEGFEWAQNTTIAQHAQWLGEAVEIAQQSGRVRLATIWNVDYTFFGIDAAAGYAIVRKDGTCPACSTLNAAIAQ